MTEREVVEYLFFFCFVAAGRPEPVDGIFFQRLRPRLVRQNVDIWKAVERPPDH